MNPLNTPILNTIIDDVFLKRPKVCNVNEIEFSLVGTKAKNEPWNLGVAMFRQLLTTFSKKTEIAPEHSILLTVTGSNNMRLRINDIKEIQKFCVHNDPLKTHENLTYEVKTRIQAIDYEEYGLRLRFNSEEVMNDDLKTRFIAEIKDEKVSKFYRHAQRYSIRLPDTFGEKGFLQFDFSSVRQGSGRDFRAAQLTGPSSLAHDRYEVEIELVDVSADELQDQKISDKIKNRLSTYLELLLTQLNLGLPLASETLCLTGLNSYLKLTEIFNAKLKRVNKSTKNLYQSSLIELSEYFMTVNISTLSLKHIQDNILLGDEGKSIAISIEDEIPDTPYYFTDKADGLRALLFIDNEGRAFLLTRTTIKQTTIVKTMNGYAEIQSKDPKQMLQIFYTGINYEDEKLYNTLLDGEYLHITIEGSKKPYFLTFDVLILNKADVTGKEFNERFNENTDYFKAFDITSEFSLSVKAKTFYPYTTTIFSDLINSSPPKIIQKMASHDGIVGLTYNMDGVISYTLDGLIFQPRKTEKSFWPVGKKTWPDVYKWKPSYMATVDMRLTYDEKTNPPVISKTSNALTIEGSSTVTKYAIFKARVERMTEPSHYNCYAKIDNGAPRTETEDGSLGEPIRKGAIVECRLSLENIGGEEKHWVPIRIRHDKSQANDFTVYSDILNTVTQNPITLATLAMRGGGLGGAKDIRVNKVNREINNKIIVQETFDLFESCKLQKPILILNLLDIGCGMIKSGTAWRELSEKITPSKLNIVGIDESDVRIINNSMIEYAKKRKPAFTSTFIHGNFNSDFKDQATVIANINLHSYNVVTCNFAIHYAMGSELTFRTFVNNISQCLTDDGVFIGAYMNKTAILENLNLKSKDLKSKDLKSKELKSDLKLVGKVSKSKDMWSIEFKTDNKSTFGSTIAVSFIELYQDHIEYLIDVTNPDITKIFSEYGLELVQHRPFNSYADGAEKKLSPDELTWFSFHYMFTFKKVSSTAVKIPQKGVASKIALAKSSKPQAKPVASSEPQPQAFTSAQPQADISAQPQADVSVHPQADVSSEPQPQADISSEPQPQAVAVASSKAVGGIKLKKASIVTKKPTQESIPELIEPELSKPKTLIKLKSKPKTGSATAAASTP